MSTPFGKQSLAQRLVSRGADRATVAELEQIGTAIKTALKGRSALTHDNYETLRLALEILEPDTSVTPEAIFERRRAIRRELGSDPEGAEANALVEMYETVFGEIAKCGSMSTVQDLARACITPLEPTRKMPRRG